MSVIIVAVSAGGESPRTAVLDFLEPDGGLLPGDDLGRYRIVEEIGRGGMGRVYRAIDPGLGREVALKVLQTSHRPARRREGDRKRFRREGRALALLSHPNVIPVYDVDTTEDGTHFIAMEYVEGLTLRPWKRAHHPGWQEIARVLREAGAGLAAAHARGLVHRDFKPANVMVGTDGRVRVMDFGLARGDPSRSGTGSMFSDPSVFLGSTEITEAGSVMGTPQYMAPEQHFGRTADDRSDQFAFCVTAWELLYGRRPFVDGEGIRVLARAKDRGEILSPPRGHGVPRWLLRAIRRGLSPRSLDRWPSMEELIAAMRPGHSSRDWVWGTAVATVLLAAGAVFAAMPRDPDCEADLEGTWDEARSGSVREHLEAVAPEAWARVGPALESWSERWRAEYQAACKDRRSDREGSDAKLACLRGQRASLAAVVDVMSGGSAAEVAGALEALPLPSRCERAGSNHRLPHDPSEREEAEALIARLAAARVFEQVGRYAQGMQDVEALHQDALALGHAPLVVEATRLHGHFLLRLGQDARAAELLEEAYHSAVSLELDEEATRAASRLVALHAGRRVDVAKAEHWLAELEARSSQVTDRPEAEARLGHARGLVAMAHGDYDVAMEAFRAALWAVGQQEHAPPMRRPPILHNLAGAQLRAGRLDDALQSLEEAVRITEEAVGTLHPSLAAMRMAMAGVHYRRQEYDRALDSARRALEIQEQTLGRSHVDLAGGLMNLAGLYEAVGRPQEARASLVRALQIWDDAEQPDPRSMAIAVGNLANLELSTGDLESAQALAQRAIRLRAEVFGEAHEEVALARSVLAAVLSERGETEAARDELRRALEGLESSVGPDHPHVSLVTFQLGELLAPRDREGALAALERSLAVAQASGLTRREADVRKLMAQLLREEQPARAQQHARAALEAYARATGDHGAQVQELEALLAELG